MNKKVFQSKLLVISVIFLFILLTSADVLPQRNVSAKSDVEKLIQEGKELYKNGEYKEAILKLLAAKDLAQTRKEISEIHFNISLAYYANNQSVKASEYLQKLLEIQPEKTINTLDYHPRFVELFNKIKSEVAKLKEKPEKPVVKAKPGKEKKVKKGGGGFLLVIGALVIGGGAAALLLGGKSSDGGTNGGITTGSIQVNSTPTGAQVFLDGSDTGELTNCTLTDVSPGSHTVMLVMEGYEDEQTSVSVTAGQTATVSVTLTEPTITVLELPTGTVWTTGEGVEIKWGVSGSGASQAVVSTGAGLDPLINQGGRALSRFQRRSFQERRFLRSEIKERRRAADVDSYGNRGMLSSNTSEPQGISGEISSSVKEGDIVHERAKDIRDIKRNSRVGIINATVVPQISSGKFRPSGDIRVLGLSNVKIDLYKGSTFNQTIVSSTENDGSYLWTVDPSLTDGTDYKVRISSPDDSTVYGESDAFTIEEKSITVTEPTSTTVWARGFPADITWTSNGTISDVMIDLYKGDTLNQTIVSSTANDGSYTWMEVVTSLADGTDYKVRISSIEDSTVYGESDAFRIEDKSITVTEPTDTTVWTRGFPADITWTSNGMISNVKIDLYKGGTFNQTIVSSTANDGSYTWTQVDTSLADGSDYKVRVSSTSDTSIYGESDDFTIEEKSITVTEPTSTTIWTKGKSADITWTSNGTISDVKIDLYKGGTFNQTIVSSTTNDGSYIWTSVDTSLVDGSDYKVRISSTSDPTVYGESDQFTIEEKSITITSPTSSTVWTKGQSAEIVWTSTGTIGLVNIDLYKGSTAVEQIASGTDNDGSFTWTTVDPSLADGTDYKIRISSSNNINIYDDSDVYKIVTEVYEFVTKWGSEGTGDGQFKYPADVAVDNSGNVYVVDDGFQDRIQKFTSSGSLVTKWGSEGTGDGQFDYPNGVTVDISGYVYVADTRNNRIQKFTPSGSFVTKWGSGGSGDGQLSYPLGIAIDNSGYVYVADGANQRIQVFTSTGTFLRKWGSFGTGDGQFDAPYGIAVDSSGYVYVVDASNNRIQKFTSNGIFVTKWGSQGDGDGQFNSPLWIAVDSSDNVYVTDEKNNRIQKFTSTGTFLIKWGSFGTGDGYFKYPRGIAVDSSGYVYVVDCYNHRIQKFSPASGTQQLTRSNSKVLNNNFSVDKNSAQKSRNIKAPIQKRSKQPKQIKKKDEGNEKRK